MSRNNANRDIDYARAVSNIAKLPARCYSNDLATGATICIRRGKMGFYPIVTEATATYLNSLLGPPPTPAQIGAMEVGSMFGWDVPGADSDDPAHVVPFNAEAV